LAIRTVFPERSIVFPEDSFSIEIFPSVLEFSPTFVPNLQWGPLAQQENKGDVIEAIVIDNLFSSLQGPCTNWRQ
jgi:hypothetical protein